MTEKRFIIDEEKIKNNHINYIQVLQNLLSNEGLELTEKRFKVTDNTNNPFLCDWNVTDYADGIVHHPMTSENMANVICDLLNGLNDENKQLQNTIARLQLINDKLRDKDYSNYKKKIQELQEENERLRKCINEIYTIARLEEV